MKKLTYTLLGVAPAALLAAPAQAQDSSPFSVRLGFNRPADSDTRSTVGNGFLLGLSYTPTKSTGPFEGRIDLDYGRFSKSGDQATSIGLGYTALWKITGKGSPAGAYGGVGLGIHRVSVRAAGSGGGSEPGGSDVGTLTGFRSASSLGDLNGGDGVDAHETKLGAKLVLGYNFSDRLYGEAVYNKIGKVDGADPSQLALTVGFRF
jgi:hypothetical protein